MRISRFSRRLVLLPAAMLALAALRAPAAVTIVWQIGAFDHSSAELAQRNWDMPGHQEQVVYIIGKSTPSVDWPASQPGSSNDKAGRRPHPYAIQFNLPNTPQGLYTLKVGLIAGGTSMLQVEINGQQGLAFQHPQLNKVWLDALGGQTRIAEMELELPLSALKPGNNSLVLTAIDPAQAAGEIGNSALTYDAVELDHEPDQDFISDKVTVILEPTIFYRQREGQLVEEVNASIWHNWPIHKGRVDFTVSGKRYSADLAPGRDFG